MRNAARAVRVGLAFAEPVRYMSRVRAFESGAAGPASDRSASGVYGQFVRTTESASDATAVVGACPATRCATPALLAEAMRAACDASAPRLVIGTPVEPASTVPYR